MSLFSNISNFVGNQLGLGQTTIGQDPNLIFPPWVADYEQNPKKEFIDPFFEPYRIDRNRWNKLYPYRLLVIDVKNGNRVVGSGDISKVSNKFSEVVGADGIEYIFSQDPVSSSWEYYLPISPQQLQVTDQFAINTSATMRGVVEEHNGVKFKLISASGTTGIWPQKPTVGGNISRPTVLGSVLGGTLQGVQDLTQSLSGLKSIATGKHPSNAPETQQPRDLAQTGYYQALYLGQFLEAYAQAKKRPEFSGWRLVFDIPKQNQSFIVTPISFTMSQSEQRPNQYMFSFQLKAWKRVNLDQEVAGASSSLPDLGSPNIYQRVVGSIEQTRRVLANARNLVRAVRSDVQGVFENLRQISLVVKDTGGLVFAIADLPNQIIKDAKSVIEESLANIRGAFTPPGTGTQGQSGVAGISGRSISTSGLGSTSKAGVIAQSMANQRAENEGLSKQAVADGALGPEAAQRIDTDPVNEIFDNPEENFELFNALTIDDVKFNTRQLQAIDDEIQRSRLTTVNDLREIKADFIKLSNEIADNYGAVDPTYASIYGLPEPRQRSIPLSIEENEILKEIFEVIQSIDLITATKQFDDLKRENTLEFVGALADEAGIDFEQFPSKVVQPVPFGATIEEIAARYMGDSSKWVEVAAANGLRSPYIDEEGFIYDLLSNASGRQFNVDDEEGRLYIGQRIVLFSNTTPRFTRTITNLEKIGDNNFLVTVDGEANLGTLTTAQGAKIQGYLPGTVNSQNRIFIPVELPSDEDDRTFEIPRFSDNQISKISKVDLLLTDSFDLAINSIGDFRLSTGLTNLVQALKMKIRTQKGTLLRHLNYGLGIEHGVSVADIENGEILKQLNKLVSEDPRFEGIQSIDIRLFGSTLGIDMVISLAGGSGVLPINFDIRPT